MTAPAANSPHAQSSRPDQTHGLKSQHREGQWAEQMQTGRARRQGKATLLQHGHDFGLKAGESGQRFRLG